MMTSAVKYALAIALAVLCVVAAWQFVGVDRDRNHTLGSSEEPATVSTVIRNESRTTVVQEIVGDEKLAISEVNPAFKDVDEQTEEGLALYVEQKYFLNGIPKKYVQHRIVEINSELMETQFLSSFRSWDDGNQVVPVVIPLFDGQSVEIVVQLWIEATPGFKSASGAIYSSEYELDNSLLSSNAWFTFADFGRLDGTINTNGHTYLFSVIREQPYYILMELTMNHPDVLLE